MRADFISRNLMFLPQTLSSQFDLAKALLAEVPSYMALRGFKPSPGRPTAMAHPPSDSSAYPAAGAGSAPYQPARGAGASPYPPPGGVGASS